MRISAKRVSVIESRKKVPLFVCVLMLLIFLTGAHTASAHGGAHENSSEHGDITTSDVNDKESMEKFLLHVKAHSQFTTLGELSSFKAELTMEGDWKKGSFYVMRIDKRGVIISHPYHAIAQNGTLYNFTDDRGVPVIQQLIEKATADVGGDRCVEYNWDDPSDKTDQNPKVSCAVKNVEPLSGLERIIVVGFHHDFKDVVFANIKCPYASPDVSANEVVNEDSLKQFVKGFADHYLNLREKGGVREFINARNCIRISPWRRDSIYLFIMTDSTKSVVFNGNDPTLEDKTLDVKDKNECDVGNEIIRVITNQARQCKDLGLLPEDSEDSEGFFVQYLWDDPADDIPPIIKEGRAPGDVPKLSYVQIIVSNNEQENVIVGAGIYPEAKEDDGGCAIAGSADTPKRAIFNLFLIVSMLFSVALSRNPRAKQTMKTLTAKVARRSRVAALFICVLALLVFFSGARTASAHDDHSYGVTAGEVTAGDMGKMLELVLHAKAHWESIDNPNDNIEFEQELTVEGGDWNNGTIYLMVIDKEGSVFTHADDPEAQNLTLAHYSGEAGRFGRQTELDEEIRELIDAAGNGGGCVPYEEGGEQRVACATVFTHPVWQSDLILLAGYHHVHDIHDEDEVGFDHIECPYFISETINEPPYFKQGIGADKVVDSDSLEEFVDEFVKHFSEQIESGQNPAQLAKIRNCWRSLPWKYGAVYVFIMTENNLVFFNGNGPYLENRSFNVRDDNECDVGNEVIRVARGQDRQCKDLGLLPEESGGFVQYLWDDPTDDILPVIEEGRAPGDVPKLSYVVSYSNNDFLGGEKLIIGSGFHPGVSGDDDGCGIAGTGSRAKGALFNLFLIVLVLFSVALWKNRSK